jgi:hypothetical protein
MSLLTRVVADVEHTRDVLGDGLCQALHAPSLDAAFQYLAVADADRDVSGVDLDSDRHV